MRNLIFRYPSNPFGSLSRIGLSACVVFCVCLLSGFSALADDNDWSRWRGPEGNGVALENAKPLIRWSDTKNVVWKSKIPGRGHSSPIVVGDRIYLTTAEKDSQTQSVLCYERVTGQQLWKTVVNEGGFARRIHPNNSHASSTIATDGKQLFAVFSHHNQVELAKLDMEGKVQWKKVIGNYRPKYPFGFGATPILYKSFVLVTNENQDNGGVFALNQSDGETAWSIDRGGLTSFSTPVIAKLDGKDQLLLSGGQSVRSYDPNTGKENWKANAKWIVTCGTMVWDGDLVFASGGFPAPQTVAVNYKTGKVVWQNAIKCYEQSMLAHDGYIYAHADNGGLYCWRASDGKEMWKERFQSRVSVSPTLVNGNVHFTAENGRTMIAKCTPEGFKKVSENKLGDSAFASPAFCGEQMFQRVGVDGQEYLFCIGKRGG